MDFIDVKYINLISSRLSKFKKVKPYLYNFRCPICGDSQKHKNKARGYLYRVKNNTNYKCHNCGVSLSFNNFLKEVECETHKQYIFEKFKEGHTGKNYVTESPEDVFKALDTSKPKFEKRVKMDLPSAFDVPRSKKYLEERAIFSGDFYYCEDFNKFTGSDSKYEDPRIVIPLIKDNVLIGIQGRALDRNPIKYLTVMFDDDAPKIYGYDTVTTDRPIYILEGPFDSTFVENSVAMCGADVDIRSFGWSDYIWVYDNEPRSRQITDKLSQSIDRGDKVVIWPSAIEHKDLNDMANYGINVKDVVQSNVYSGLEAKLKLSNWKI